LAADERGGFLETANESLQVFLKDDDLVSLEVALTVLLAFDNIHEQITHPVFLHVEEIRTLLIGRRCLGGEHLSSLSHVFSF
jgi:hypothetical protein